MHPFFTLGNVVFPAYGCWILLGLLCAFGYLWFFGKSSGFPREDLIYAGLYAVIGALIGAKLLYLLTLFPVIVSRWAEFTVSPGLFFQLLRGGFVFYGGLIGGIYGVYRYGRRYRLDFLPLIDGLAVAVPLSHVFGRIGCLFAGCCYGLPYNGPGAVVYPEDTFGLSGVSLFPLPLAEAAGNALLFLVLLGLRRKPRYAGMLSGVYLCVYAVFRFVLEFFRGDALRGLWLGLSTSQWLSLPLFAAGVFLLVTAKKRV